MTTTDTITNQTQPTDADIEAFADKVFGDVLGAMNNAALTIGVRLGWYEALAAAESMTSADLAEATRSDERYAREWLEHQTLAGYVDVLDARTEPVDRCYALSSGAAEVLTNRESLDYLAPFPGFVSTLGTNIDAIVDAYRTGSGVGWHEHGDGARCGQADANRPFFLQLLAREHLASIPDIDARLRSGGRVADVGCGYGWSSIAVAQAYPNTTVEGFDIDAPSVAQANENAVAAGVADRVTFHTIDAGQADAVGYDLVMAMECIHDMPDPVSVLASMRSMASADGAVVVMDERVGDVFTGEPNPIEQLLYGFSLMCCLPDGRNAEESVATGTIMRLPTFEGYAKQAGFTEVEVLPIENDMFRFYRLER